MGLTRLYCLRQRWTTVQTYKSDIILTINHGHNRNVIRQYCFILFFFLSNTSQFSSKLYGILKTSLQNSQDYTSVDKIVSLYVVHQSVVVVVIIYYNRPFMPYITCSTEINRFLTILSRPFQRDIVYYDDDNNNEYLHLINYNTYGLTELVRLTKI